jgi:hypothetical protein
MSEENPKAVIVTEDESDTDWEAEARAEGWVPEGEWQGTAPKHGFMEAKEFVKRGREVLPIVQARNRRMEGELASLRTQLTELQGTASRFNQFAQQAVERERREKEQLLQQLEARRAQAITEGDGNTAVAAERQISNLKAEFISEPVNTGNGAAPPQQYTEEQLRPIKEFMTANPWYASDPDMRDWADARAVRLKNDGMPQGPAMLAKVADEARRVWAHKFQSNGSVQTPVEGSGRRIPEQFGKKTFDDLPADAKRAYDEFRKTNPKLTKADYLNLYEWD